nr:unnamed protein product [Callosobruchus chinensis]
MSSTRFLTQEELEAVVVDVGEELSSHVLKMIDAVYIRPDVDTLTDEEHLDDNMLDSRGAGDIAGTF